MKPAHVIVAIIWFSGCSSPATILNDERVVALLGEAETALKAAGLDMPIPGIVGCTDNWTNKEKIAAWDYSSKHPDNPKFSAPNLEGHWTAINCVIYAEEGKVPSSTRCTQELTYTAQSGGRITQTNSGAASSGSGTVGFIAGIGTDNRAFVMQTNSASGSGCSQELVNLLTFAKLANGNWEMLNFNGLLSSTCDAPRWGCGRMELVRD